MANGSPKLIQGVWPLPGGNDRYLHTLDQAIKFVAAATHPIRTDLANWLKTQYNVGDGSLDGYLQVIYKIGVIEALLGDAICVSAFGKRVMEAEGQEKAKLILNRFMQDYLGFREVLATFAAASVPVHTSALLPTWQSKFPMWTSSSQYDYRTTWLLSLGCLSKVSGRTYEITSFGQEIAARYQPETTLLPSSSAISHPVLETLNITDAEPSSNEINSIVTELKSAATDGANPERLERAVARAFELLGFSVDLLGDGGDTDVLVQANVGPESYTAIADAKARKTGKLLDLDAFTLLDHLKKNRAKYAVVVAGDFAAGKVAAHAEESGIALLNVGVFSDLLRLHGRTPLNLIEYRAIFEKPGLVTSLPATILAAAEQRRSWANLIVDLIDLFSVTYQNGLLETQPSNQLFAMLVTRLKGVRYPRQQVDAALSLMTSQAIAAVVADKEHGYSLAVNRATFVRSLRALAEMIETTEAEG